MIGAYECIRTRRAVREFKSDLVPDAIVHNILRAGRWAPSSSNTQPWHFVVVRDRETIAALGRIATQRAFIGQAPLAIAIVMENARRPRLDAGQATRHDDEYERKGTYGILLAFEPLRGWRFVQIRKQRTAVDYAAFMQELVEWKFTKNGARRKLQKRYPMLQN